MSREPNFVLQSSQIWGYIHPEKFVMNQAKDLGRLHTIQMSRKPKIFSVYIFKKSRIRKKWHNNTNFTTCQFILDFVILFGSNR